MNLSQEKLEKVRNWGRFNIPPQKMAVLLCLSANDREEFIVDWQNPYHEIRTMWEDGRVKAEIEVMESLENFANKEEEGSGEAAKALGYVKNRQMINQLKSDLLGI